MNQALQLQPEDVASYPMMPNPAVYQNQEHQQQTTQEHAQNLGTTDLHHQHHSHFHSNVFASPATSLDHDNLPSSLSPHDVAVPHFNDGNSYQSNSPAVANDQAYSSASFEEHGTHVVPPNQNSVYPTDTYPTGFDYL